jgi:DNA-binding HxlR family transcriptional regulator
MQSDTLDSAGGVRRRVVDMAGDRLTRTMNQAAILNTIAKRGPRRFSDFKADLGLRDNVVSRSLKALARDHLLVASIEPGTYPNVVRYELTAAGRAELNNARARGSSP